MKRNQYTIHAVTVFLFLFVFLIIFSFVKNLNSNSHLGETIQHSYLPFFQNPINHESIARKTKIRFVGDVMLARNVENLIKAYGIEYPTNALPVQPKDSYLVGNFESAIPQTHIHTPSMGFSFSTRKENLEVLTNYGFTHMGISNNHSYDFGVEAFLYTKQTLIDAKLHPFGDQLSQASSTIQYISIKNEVVALIGIYAVDAPPSLQEIELIIKNASKESTLQIAYVHFGTEYEPIHSKFQERLARNLIDAGVDIVIGHHPHVVQDIELYKGRIIFYSLGNFIFDQYFSQEVQEGLLLELSLSQDSMTFTLLPITSIGSRSVPRMMEQYEKETFLTQLAKKSDAELAIMLQRGEITVAK